MAARGVPAAARPALTRLVWLCAVSVALVPPCRPCTGFVSPSVLPMQPSAARGLAKILSLRSRGALRGPAMVYSPLRPTQAASTIGLQGLETFPEVPLDFTGHGNRTTEFSVNAERATTSSLYGQWRPTVVPAVEVTPEGLPRAAKGKFLTPAVRADARPTGTGQRGRPRSKPLAPIKPELVADFVWRAAQVLTAHRGKMDSNLFGQHWKQLHKENPLQRYKTHQAITLHSMLSESSEIFKVSDTDRAKVKMFELLECDLAELELAARPAGEAPRSPSVSPSLLPLQAHPTKASAPPASSDASSGDGDEAEPAPVKRVGRPKGKRAVGMQPVASVMAQQADEQEYSHVPVQGKARNSLAFDRRSAKKNKPTLRQNLELLNEEAKPAAPFSSQGDAVQNAAVKMYNSWAMDGRDVVMEATHHACVDEMIELALKDNVAEGTPFTAIDAGCGNGWATRLLAAHELCEGAVGVDAAELMVQRANDIDGEGDAEYVLSDVHSWKPEAPVDVVLANELLYLLDYPQVAVAHMVEWLRPGGRLVAGLDCYAENKLSHTWAEDLSIPMHCLSETIWEQYLLEAGLTDIKLLRSEAPGPWAGTLIITGTKPAR